MRRHPWLVVSILAVLGVLILGAFPARAYLEQVRQREDLTARAKLVEGANEALRAQAARLQTDEVVERLARERYQLVRPGEEAYAVLPDAEAPSVPPPVPAPPLPHQGWWSRTWSRVTSIL